MLPMTRNAITPQNKLSGMRIAFGEASWGDMGDGEEGYIFPPDIGFKWEQTADYFAERGYDQEELLDALLDCVEQVEDQLGGPDSTRDQYGMYRGGGHAYLGLTAQSNIDPRVTLHFIPTSVDGSPVTAYFEWYLRDGDSLPFDDTEALEVEFARIAGVSLAMPDAPIDVLPAYEDAARTLLGMPLIEDARREAFLERLFRLEKTLAPGFRLDERRELLSQWKTLTEAADVVALAPRIKAKKTAARVAARASEGPKFDDSSLRISSSSSYGGPSWELSLTVKVEKAFLQDKNRGPGELVMMIHDHVGKIANKWLGSPTLGGLSDRAKGGMMTIRAIWHLGAMEAYAWGADLSERGSAEAKPQNYDQRLAYAQKAMKEMDEYRRKAKMDLGSLPKDEQDAVWKEKYMPGWIALSDKHKEKGVSWVVLKDGSR